MGATEKVHRAHAKEYEKVLKVGNSAEIRVRRADALRLFKIR